jgi:hypothetical protein
MARNNFKMATNRCRNPIHMHLASRFGIEAPEIGPENAWTRVIAEGSAHRSRPEGPEIDPKTS